LGETERKAIACKSAVKGRKVDNPRKCLTIVAYGGDISWPGQETRFKMGRMGIMAKRFLPAVYQRIPRRKNTSVIVAPNKLRKDKNPQYYVFISLSYMNNTVSGSR
jgi:hypothetical protein